MLALDGVANGYNVWNWNNFCTASGYGTSITWCGTIHNGGYWPYSSMQEGLNYNYCIGPAGIGCFGHGFRNTLNTWGNLVAISDW